MEAPKVYRIGQQLSEEAATNWEKVAADLDLTKSRFIDVLLAGMTADEIRVCVERGKTLLKGKKRTTRNSRTAILRQMRELSDEQLEQLAKLAKNVEKAA